MLALKNGAKVLLVLGDLVLAVRQKEPAHLEFITWRLVGDDTVDGRYFGNPAMHWTLRMDEGLKNVFERAVPRQFDYDGLRIYLRRIVLENFGAGPSL